MDVEKLMYKLKKITGTLHEDRYTILIITRSVLIIMRNVSDNSCRENQNTHLLFSKFFHKTCHLWDNVEKLLYNLTITGTLHEERYTILIISRSFLIIIKNDSDNRCRENQNTHFRFSEVFSYNVPCMR
jgi:hypothetical protein